MEDFLLLIAKFLAIVVPVYLAIYKADQLFESGCQEVLSKANNNLMALQNENTTLRLEISRLYGKIDVLNGEVRSQAQKCQECRQRYEDTLDELRRNKAVAETAMNNVKE